MIKITQPKYSYGDIVNLKNKKGIIERWRVNTSKFNRKVGWLYELHAFDHAYAEEYNVREKAIFGHYAKMVWKDVKEFLASLSPSDIESIQVFETVMNLKLRGKILDWNFDKDAKRFDIRYPEGINEVVIAIYELPPRINEVRTELFYKEEK